MKITIIGGGYVGLVSAACFASSGNHVTIADVSDERIAQLERGESPIYEPGLEDLLVENTRAERLRFTTDVAEACQNVDLIGIAVGTPSRSDGSCDLQYVMSAAEMIAKSITERCVVMTKSTVPVGTGKRVVDLMRSLTDIDFAYVSNPEFLKEGTAVKDFMYPERIVVGSESERALKLISHLYRPFMRRGDRIICTDVASAELAKYACNSMLATRISFMNELSQLAEKVGADIDQVRRAMGTDSRIGNSFLFPGIGYGGSCFPKDVQALSHAGDEFDVRLDIVKAVHSANQRQITFFFNKIKHYWNGQLRGRKFAVWGLAFKPQTDDIREAPALKLITRLIDYGCGVAVHDPEALENTKRQFGNRLEYCANPYETLGEADALVICTEWLEYRTPDFNRIAESLKEKVLFDGRNLYDREILDEYGLKYVRIG